MEDKKLGAPVGWALLFVFYFACTYIIIFFNAALVFCALQGFAGKEPSLRAGIATAAGRWPQILAWAFVAATVGLILNALQSFLKDKLGFIGALLGGIAETAWAVITFFVVPVIVVDGAGPVEAMRRSSAILKRTWGEAIGGEGGLGLDLGAVLPAGRAAVRTARHLRDRTCGRARRVAVALIVLVAVYLVALVVVFTALGTIFRTGTYVYATTGKAPSHMDPALLQGDVPQEVMRLDHGTRRRGPSWAQLLVAAVIMVAPVRVHACACCTEQGQRLETTDALRAYERGELERVEFAATARLYTTAAFPDDIKGLATPSEEPYGFRGSLVAGQFVFEISDKSGKTGQIIMALPRQHDTLRDRPSQRGRAGRRNGSGSLQGVAAGGRSTAPRHSGERRAASHRGG